MADNFLKNSYNKNKLNEYLARKLIELHQGHQVFVVTYKDTTLSIPSLCEELDQCLPIRPCQAEEADQRLVRHAINMIYHGYKNTLIRTIDTDVLILLIAHIGQIDPLDTNISAYMIKSGKHYNIRKIVQEIGSKVCRALPFFKHFLDALVSSFYEKGKCKAYDVWSKSTSKDESSRVFTELGEKPTKITENQVDELERYVLEMYSAKQTTLGAARLDKFKKSADNDLRLLPPSREALRQHANRSAYQSGYLWRQWVEELDIPEPEQWGWIFNTTNVFYRPIWTNIQSSITVKSFTRTDNISCISMCACSRSCKN